MYISLAKAIETNDVVTIQERIAQGIPISNFNINRKSALVYALDCRCTTEIFQLLLCQYPFDAGINERKVSLLFASGIGRLDIVQLLLRTNVGLDVPDKNFCPLHVASENGQLSVVKLFLSRGFDVDATDSHGTTPLYLACSTGKYEVVKELIEHGAKVDFPAKDSHDTALFVACKNGHLNIVKLLLSKNANINIPNNLGFAPIHAACYGGHLEIVELLISNKANFDVFNCNNLTPLDLACQQGELDMVELLLKHGASFGANMKKYLDMLLYHASADGNSNLVTLALSKGANPNVLNRDGATPLYVACEGGLEGIVEILLQHKASIDMATEELNTPFHIACKAGNVKIVNTLLEKGVDIDCKNAEHWTPLHISCMAGHRNVAEILLNHNASISLVTKTDGNTPLHLACVSRNVELVRLLLSHNPNVAPFNNNGQTPLHMACIVGSKDIAEELIKRGAPVNAHKPHGNTPLHCAYSSNRLELVKLLLAHGADPDACGRKPSEQAFKLRKYPKPSKDAFIVGEDGAMSKVSIQSSMELEVSNDIGLWLIQPANYKELTKNYKLLLQAQLEFQKKLQETNPPKLVHNLISIFDMFVGETLRSYLEETCKGQKFLLWKALFLNLVKYLDRDENISSQVPPLLKQVFDVIFDGYKPPSLDPNLLQEVFEIFNADICNSHNFTRVFTLLSCNYLFMLDEYLKAGELITLCQLSFQK